VQQAARLDLFGRIIGKLFSNRYMTIEILNQNLEEAI